MVVVTWFSGGHVSGGGNVVSKWFQGGHKVARKPIVVDTRGFRAVWNGLNMFEYPPAWCQIMC